MGGGGGVVANREPGSYIDIFCIIHAIQMLKSVLKSVRDSKKMLYDSNLFHGGG